jgi:ATP-dependent Lhr-like helicase
VDLVIQVGAPKGLSRLVQRIGRANHRLDEPSRALLVPSNRFEVLECQAAAGAVMEGELDGEVPRRGGLDVLAQHILGVACGGPFRAGELYEEVRRASPYEGLSRDTFDAVLDYVATGGYALRQYERYARLVRDSDGYHHVTGPRVARQYRLNVGTIVAEPMINVRLQRGRNLGQIEEWFIDQLVVGDTFAFAGEILRFEGMRETTAIVSRARGARPRCRPIMAASFPCPPILPPGCGICWRIQRRKSSCRPRFATGCPCSGGDPSCPARTACWWRRFPVAASITWSATRSRGAWRTRPWACC